MIKNIDDFSELFKANEWLTVWFSGNNCGVCDAQRPNYYKMIKEYPEVCAEEVNCEENPEVAAQMQIFTIPALLLFYQGKEIHRQARFIDLRKLENDLLRMQSIMS